MADRLGAAEWHRRVWRLAGPIMISNVSTPMIGLVDTAVVGHLAHPYYIGAVAVGALIFSFLFWGFGFLRMGTTGLTAQAAGAGDSAEVRAVLARALALAGGLGLALIAMRGPVEWLAFGLVEASAEVEGHAADYVRVRIWSAPAALANYVVLGWLLGTRRAGAALALQLVLNGTNAVLDVVFVVGLGWGVVGVAAASVIAEFTALLAGVGLIAVLLRRDGGTWSAARITDPAAFRRLMLVNRDIFIRTLCLVAAFAYFTAQGARLGDVVLAANAVLFNLHVFLAHALDGFAHAAEALVGGSVGARDNRGFRQAVRASTVWAAGTALLFSLAYFGLGRFMVDALTDIQAVRLAARDYLPWAAAMPILSVWSFQFDGIFLGATRTVALRNAMIASVALYLPAVWLLVPAFANHGLWLALAVFMVARGVTLSVAYPALARSV